MTISNSLFFFATKGGVNEVRRIYAKLGTKIFLENFVPEQGLKRLCSAYTCGIQKSRRSRNIGRGEIDLWEKD